MPLLVLHSEVDRPRIPLAPSGHRARLGADRAASFLSCETATCLSRSTRRTTSRAASRSDLTAVVLACLSSSQLDVELADLGMGLLQGELRLGRRGLLRLHLQLNLSHLKALAVDPGLHLGAGELSAGDGKAGVLVE